MMERYKVTKEVLAKPMLHDEAENLIGHKIPNLYYGSEGYVVSNTDYTDMRWIPKTVFEVGAVCVGSDSELLQDHINTLTDIKNKLDELHKKRHFSKARTTYTRYLTCKKHLDMCADLINKINDDIKQNKV